PGAPATVPFRAPPERHGGRSLQRFGHAFLWCNRLASPPSLSISFLRCSSAFSSTRSLNGALSFLSSWGFFLLRTTSRSLRHIMYSRRSSSLSLTSKPSSGDTPQSSVSLLSGKRWMFLPLGRQ